MIGQAFSHYLVTAKLGAGGMGEVYRARDTRLNREVAIKVLPSSFANDPARLLRFEQEARATSALNHPNILTIYDIGSNDGSPFIVAELLEGNDLRQLLNNGPLPQRKAVDFAEQIASGLAAAHEKGITHRDLKPENLFVTADGRIKILDFGLAKLRPQPAEPAGSGVATLKAITDPGVVMGTAGYMSPEQVRGQEVDHHSDIFSFGAILYEMLTGRRAFQRETMAETMTAILKEDPDEVTQLNNKITPQLERIVQRCLEKKPERRFQSASDLGFAIGAVSTPSGPRVDTSAVISADTATTFRNRVLANSKLAWIVAVTLLLALVIALAFAIRRPGTKEPSAPQLVRYEIQPPGKTSLSLTRWPAITLSPDGSTLAFVASAEGINRLYLRKRDDTEVRSLPGTEGAYDPVFSPDGKWVAFIADFTIKKVSVDGPVTTVLKISDGRGLTWLNEDTLIFSQGPATGLFQVSADGGEPKRISNLDESKNERTHRWPQVLPGAKAVLFTVGTLDSPDDYDRANIEAVIIATGERRVILQGASMARYVPSGHLLFARGGALFAMSFDAVSMVTRGAPAPILQGVGGDQTTGAVHFSAAADGTLAYIPGGPGAFQRRLVWTDRDGNVQPLSLPAGQYNDIRISPDGSQLAMLIGSSGSGDVWVYDFARATPTRLTFNTVNASPIWSADGKSVLYTEIQGSGNRTTVLRKPADGSHDAEALASLPDTAYVKAIERDGTSAILDAQINTYRADIIRLTLGQGTQISGVVNSQFNDYAAVLSVDGRWLAYQSNEGVRPEIYVRDLSGSGGRWQISTEGGEEPHWSADGRELYYRNNDLFMSVAVETSTGFKAGPPKRLFSGIYNLRSNSGVSYDVDPKGSRFLMIRPAEESTAPSQLRVVLNWAEELRRIAPVK
jgi:eukaryotic-like serine/threonine-protein kinase